MPRPMVSYVWGSHAIFRWLQGFLEKPNMKNIQEIRVLKKFRRRFCWCHWMGRNAYARVLLLLPPTCANMCIVRLCVLASGSHTHPRWSVRVQYKRDVGMYVLMFISIGVCGVGVLFLFWPSSVTRLIVADCCPSPVWLLPIFLKCILITRVWVCGEGYGITEYIKKNFKIFFK